MEPRQLAAALVDLVLPGDCAGCGLPAAPWCTDCGAQLGPARPARPARRAGGVAAGRYTGPLRAALLRYKERGRRDLAGPLAGLLADPLDDLLGPAAGDAG